METASQTQNPIVNKGLWISQKPISVSQYWLLTSHSYGRDTMTLEFEHDCRLQTSKQPESF